MDLGVLIPITENIKNVMRLVDEAAQGYDKLAPPLVKQFLGQAKSVVIKLSVAAKQLGEVVKADGPSAALHYAPSTSYLDLIKGTLVLFNHFTVFGLVWLNKDLIFELLAAHEDHGSGEEEKMSAKKRGRPLKISKSETKNKEEAENFDDGENMNGVLSENTNTESGVESGRKRGRASEINGNNGTVEDESGSEIKIHGNDSVKPVGFRQNGSRRKNKPQRAAEVGIECR
ncbi:uncharacterized protein LOC141679591 [Apium graveolens]|uniref:uncharacterized protein LOC141679591 n=1 Tax=Apium graveolens TaxID=4045 RepID=UPI003D7BAC06